VQSKQSTTSRLFLLTNLSHYATFFYLQDVSMCTFSNRRTCLYATCDIISYVLSRLPCFHANVSTTRRVPVRVRALKDGCLQTFWLMKSCLCVTLNVWHLVYHIISHRCSRNKVPHHDFFLLTNPSHYATFFTYKTSPCVNCHIEGRVYMQLVT